MHGGLHIDISEHIQSGLAKGFAMKSVAAALLISVSTMFVASCSNSSHVSGGTTPPPPAGLTFSAGSTFEFVQEFGTNTYDATTHQGDTITAISQDSNDNIYVAGYTAGNLPGYSGPVGLLKGMILQRDPAGNAVWGRELTTGAGDTIDGMVNVGGKMIVAGTTFGAYPGTSNPSGISEVFLAQFDAAGDLDWLHQYASSAAMTVAQMSSDQSGNLIVAGEIAGSGGSQNLYVEKFDPTGNVLWTVTYGSAAQDIMSGVTADRNGDIYAIGFTSGVYPGSQSGSPSMSFILKLSGTNGANLWVQQSNSNPALAAFAPTAITATADGQLYIEGQTGTYGMSAQIEVVKMSATSGTVAWNYPFGTGTSNLPGQGIVADSSDNLYVAGLTGGALISGVTAGVDDVFLAKLSSTGSAIWAQQIGTGMELPRMSSTGSTPIYLNLGSEGVALGGMTYGQFPGFSNPSQFAELYVARFGP